MSLWKDIIGHGWAVDMLATSAMLDKTSHAYLISGPSQVGKATLARTFAQALNCTAELAGERPCGRCRACTLIAAGRHPDVIIVRGELGKRGKRTLKIGQIRELQQSLNLTTTEARYKVAILEDFDDANPNASNAFLKTLEEPPQYAVIILTASDPDLLLPTVPSRCQQIALRPVPAKVIRRGLVDRYRLDEEDARMMAHLADGRIGWAIEASRNAELLQRRADRLAILHEIFAFGRVDRFDLASRLSRDPDELFKLLPTWLSWWRDLLNMKIMGSRYGSAVNVDDGQRIHRLARSWGIEEIIRGLRGTDEAIWQIRHNANTRLVVENLFLAYPVDRDAALNEAAGVAIGAEEREP